MQIINIDVHELAPPEPMTVILQALADLLPEQCLHVRHNREPFPLYEKLTTAGWAYYCQQPNEGDIRIYIFRQSLQPEFDQFIQDQGQL